MRFQRRTGQCGLPELLLSHSGAHSHSRGQHTVHIRCRCPVGMHSPTAIIRVQQFFPDQLHLCALLPVKLFHPSMVSARRGTSVSFPYKTGGLDVCIIFSFTQFVNRLIPLFSRMYFLHDISACAARIFCTVWQNDLLCRCTADVSYTQKTASHLLVQTRRGLLRYLVWGIGGIMSLRGGLRLSPSR